MMSNIEQITNELLWADAELSSCSARLQRENGEITKTICKAQSAFGDQKAGQEFVIALYQTMRNVVLADSALHSAQMKIRDYIQNVKK